MMSTEHPGFRHAACYVFHLTDIGQSTLVEEWESESLESQKVGDGWRNPNWDISFLVREVHVFECYVSSACKTQHLVVEKPYDLLP